MPQVIDNEDGTKTFSFNSRELRVLPELLLRDRLRNVKKMVEIAEGTQAKAIVDFVKSVVA
jgi:hypothetical protein